MKFAKLTRAKLKSLAPGSSITEHGIKFEKSKSGEEKWWIEAQIKGRRYHFVVGTVEEGYTRTQAEDILHELRASKRQSAHGHSPKSHRRVKLREAAALYIKHQEENDGRDLGNKRLNLRHLQPKLGEFFLDDFTWELLQAYRRHRSAEDASVATVNREMATLSHLFTIASRPKESNRGLGLIQARPCDIPKEREPAKVERVLADDEIGRLLDAARVDENRMIECFIMVGLHTGLRVSNILSIRLEHMNLEQGYIQIPKDKAMNKMRTQWISSVLSQYLRGYIKNNLCGDDVWLFPSSRAKTGHWVNPAKAWRRAASRAGLGRDVNRHTMRHTFATIHARAGVDTATLQALGGWKTRAMAERYTHAQGMRDVMRDFNPGQSK